MSDYYYEEVPLSSKIFGLVSLILALVVLGCLGYVAAQNFSTIKQFLQNIDQLRGFGPTGSPWVDLVLFLSPLLGWILVLVGGIFIVTGRASGVALCLFGYIITWALLVFYMAKAVLANPNLMGPMM